MPDDHQQIFPVIRQITFPNGGQIDVHKVEDGKVFYQVWPAGVMSQSALANLRRKPQADFDRAISEHGGVDVAADQGDCRLGGRYEVGLAHGQADHLNGKPKLNPYPPDTAEYDGYGDGYEPPIP